MNCIHECLTPVLFGQFIIVTMWLPTISIFNGKSFSMKLKPISNKMPSKRHWNTNDKYPMSHSNTNKWRKHVFYIIYRTIEAEKLFEFHSPTAYHPYPFSRPKYIGIYRNMCICSSSGTTNSISIGLLLFMCSRSSSINTWFSVVFFHYVSRLIISRSFIAPLNLTNRCFFIQKIDY